MFEKYSLTELLEEESRRQQENKKREIYNSTTSGTRNYSNIDNYSPLYDNGGYCSKFN
jgi:predicted transcriptional regulator